MTSTNTQQIENLNGRFSEYAKIFGTLPPVDPNNLSGVYIFIPLGSLFKTKLVMASVIWLDLPGLLGKKFDLNEGGTNLCFIQGDVKKVGSMYIDGCNNSAIDGKPSLMIKQRCESRLLRLVTDELRVLNDDTIMGIGYFTVKFGKTPHAFFPHPFLLKKTNGYLDLSNPKI